jgi:hypothetical protein
MRIGTKSVLFGAHQFLIHPWFVAWAWKKLYGFPRDPRLWVAFFVHDLGYWGKPNMDGKEGEWHPMLGSRIMWFLFDRECWDEHWLWGLVTEYCNRRWGHQKQGMSWGSFSLYHSRYLAKSVGHPYSRLCVADKLAIALTPAWLYLPLVNLTGEIKEYLKNAQVRESNHWKPTGYDQRKWYAQLRTYMTEWAETHKHGAEDTWTNKNRHSISDTGVWR